MIWVDMKHRCLEEGEHVGHFLEFTMLSTQNLWCV